jgi:hypothetical protein
MKATVMVQASIPTAPSVIQAEAQALLAARIAAGLKLQQQTFLTDNITLAQAATAGPDCLQEVPWEIRRYIADYIQISSFSSTSAYHIKRDLGHKEIKQQQQQQQVFAIRHLPCLGPFFPSLIQK